MSGRRALETYGANDEDDDGGTTIGISDSWPMAAYLFESPFHRFLRETLTRRGTLFYDRFIEPGVWIAAAATGMRPPNSLAFATFGADPWRS